MNDDSVKADATSAVPQPRMRMTPPRYGDGEPIPKDTIRNAMPGASPAEVDRVFQWIAHRSAEVYHNDLEAGRLKATAAERRRLARRVEERRMGLERATGPGPSRSPTRSAARPGRSTTSTGCRVEPTARAPIAGQHASSRPAHR